MANIDIRLLENGEFALIVDNEWYATGDYEYINEMAFNFHQCENEYYGDDGDSEYYPEYIDENSISSEGADFICSLIEGMIARG